MPTPDEARAIIEKYYGLIDAGDLPAACQLMSPDVKLTFANAAPVFGREAAEKSIQLVLDHCRAVKHSLVTWFPEELADGSINSLFEIRIRYDLNSGKVLDNPGCVFATINADGLITEQRLYGDLNEVFADGAE